MMKNILVTMLVIFGFVFTLPALAQGSGTATSEKCSEKSSEKCTDKSKDCCEKTCSTCASVCEDTLKYCLEKGGKYAEAEHVKVLKDCIAMCKLSSDFESRDSQFRAKVQELCAEICARCAESCASFDDPKMKDCAKQCDTCSASCKKSSK